MRFPVHFTRIKPATPGTATLGGDTTPAGPPVPASMDNLLISKNSNINGWPVHRIAITYKFTGVGPATNLTARVLFFEEATQTWYQIGADLTLKPGTVTFADIISLADPPQTQANIAAGNSGSITQFLQVDATGAADGTYDFAMGPDLTTFP